MTTSISKLSDRLSRLDPALKTADDIVKEGRAHKAAEDLLGTLQIPTGICRIVTSYAMPFEQDTIGYVLYHQIPAQIARTHRELTGHFQTYHKGNGLLCGIFSSPPLFNTLKGSESDKLFQISTAYFGLLKIQVGPLCHLALTVSELRSQYIALLPGPGRPSDTLTILAHQVKNEVSTYVRLKKAPNRVE